MVANSWEECFNDDKDAAVFTKIWFMFQTKDNDDCKKYKERLKMSDLLVGGKYNLVLFKILIMLDSCRVLLDYN